MSAAPALAPLIDASLPDQRALTPPESAALAALPGAPALYLLLDGEERPVLLATTQHLRRAVLGRLAEPDAAARGRADLREVVRGVRWRVVTCPFEARWRYFLLARQLYPREYRELIGFGPAGFLSVDWSRPIPEIRAGERVYAAPGKFVGPWLTPRAAQQALEGLWDLFDLCRYPEQVRRAPRGQRCAYADMGRCDAPCDGSAPLAAYAERCRAAWGFACGGAEAWLAEATRRMAEVAAAWRFEAAGVIKEQIAFARRWQTEQQPRLRRAEAWRELIALPVTRRKAWKLFVFRAGELIDGPVVPYKRAADVARAWLTTVGVEPLCPTVRSVGSATSAPSGVGPATSTPRSVGPLCPTADAAGDAVPPLPAATDAAPPPPIDDVLRMEQAWLVAHLHHSREAENAVFVALDSDAALESLSERLTPARIVL